MANSDPSAPSQPSQQTGLNQAFNPASKTAYEASTSQDPSLSAGQTIDHRREHDVPSTHDQDQSQATSTSLGQGDTGTLKERDISSSDRQNYTSPEQADVEGEQMRAPGEGEVADSVANKPGGGHKGQESITQNLDDKTREHEEELHRRGQRTGAEIDEERSETWTGQKADIQEALGGRDTKIVLAAEE